MSSEESNEITEEKKAENVTDATEPEESLEAAEVQAEAPVEEGTADEASAASEEAVTAEQSDDEPQVEAEASTATEPEEGAEAAEVQAEAPAAEGTADEESAASEEAVTAEQSDDETQVEAEARQSAESTESSGNSNQDDAEGDPFSEERIERILDIELPVNISFGSTKRPLSEVLKLGPGALLELDRAADEPVVLKVNNKVIAKGEIVDVDGYYGVHITEISSPAQRIASLGD